MGAKPAPNWTHIKSLEGHRVAGVRQELQVHTLFPSSLPHRAAVRITGEGGANTVCCLERLGGKVGPCVLGGGVNSAMPPNGTHQLLQAAVMVLLGGTSSPRESSCP